MNSEYDDLRNDDSYEDDVSDTDDEYFSCDTSLGNNPDESFSCDTSLDNNPDESFSCHTSIDNNPDENCEERVKEISSEKKTTSGRNFSFVPHSSLPKKKC